MLINLPTLLPFLALLLSVVCLWIDSRLSLGLLVVAVIAAYFTGALAGTAALWIALLGALAWAHSRATGWRCLVTGVVFAVFAVAMGLALLPGFPRVVLADNVVLSPGALPYTLGLGFPKVVGGIFILAFMHPERVRSWRELGGVLARVAPIYLLTVVAVMAVTLAMGYVKFDPKWTSLFFAWALANLFFTCLSEEAFFRGFLQREIARMGSDRRRAAVIAIAVSSMVFGLAHFGGGWKYALAAAIAGAGYGIAYHRTQRVEGSMAVHFGLNAAHFLLFTYPALAVTAP